jgi:thioredoxin reductase (NADPH)
LLLKRAFILIIERKITMTNYDVIIVGGGPAGLTAGIYLARAKAKVLILELAMPGGQINLTHLVENYPGIESISGYMLGATMKKQATKFGCELKGNAKIKSINLESEIKRFELENGDILEAKAVILSPGGRSRNLNVKGEKQFAGKGISYCATCDGDFFQDKNIIVVGGGNSALEEAVELTKYASKVTIVHQFDHFQAFQHAIEKAQQNEKISFIMESIIEEFVGEHSLSMAKIKHLPTGQISEMPIDGTFIFIGYVANTEFLKGIVELNKWGEIVTDNKLATNIKNVYAAGDARDTDTRQITTAVADGTRAALAVMQAVFS